jgi:hypothetical protein
MTVRHSLAGSGRHRSVKTFSRWNRPVVGDLSDTGSGNTKRGEKRGVIKRLKLNHFAEVNMENLERRGEARAAHFHRESPNIHPELRFQVDTPSKPGIQSYLEFLHLFAQAVELSFELLDVLLYS